MERIIIRKILTDKITNSMVNKKLNEVTTVSGVDINNVKTFLAVMNDGSIQQMSKADTASVLGELIGPPLHPKTD